VVTMFNTKDTKSVKVMKFKGEIKDLPVCALLDSGDTYSFVNPIVFNLDQHQLVQTIPMIVTVTNGARMVIDQQCKD
jgi:uncharacterized protein (DUF1499 family)